MEKGGFLAACNASSPFVWAATMKQLLLILTYKLLAYYECNVWFFKMRWKSVFLGKVWFLKYSQPIHNFLKYCFGWIQPLLFSLMDFPVHIFFLPNDTANFWRVWCLFHKLSIFLLLSGPYSPQVWGPVRVATAILYQSWPGLALLSCLFPKGLHYSWMVGICQACESNLPELVLKTLLKAGT